MAAKITTVTRTEITGGKFRYTATREDGTTTVELKASGRKYDAASLYLIPSRDEYVVFLHRDAAVAMKGSSDARACGFTMIGTLDITV